MSKQQHSTPLLLGEDEILRIFAASVRASTRIDPCQDPFDFLVAEHKELTKLVSPSPDFCSYIDDPRTVHFTAIIAAAMERRGETSAGQLAVLLWQNFWFANAVAGRVRKFRLERELAEIFICTDVKVPCDAIQLPHRFMAVSLPKDVFVLQDLRAGTALSCTYLLITKQKLLAVDSPSLDSIAMADLDADGYVDTLNVLAISANDPQDRLAGVTLIDSLPLRSSHGVSEELAIFAATKEARYQRGDSGGIRIAMPEGTPRKDPLVLLFGLAANLALYCTNRSADVIATNQPTLDSLEQRVRRLVLGKKRQRAQAALDEARRKTVLVIGKNFHARDQQVLRYRHLPHTLTSRHVVRGHWKQQVCGPGRVDRKHLFVEPYWRGPELAEVISRDYVVTAGSTETG